MRKLVLVLALVLTAGLAADEKEKTVSLDVKDEDVRVILKSMQKQCGIRNLLIDKEVQGQGMVYFKDVPCATAFKVVFGQFGLTGQVEPNIVVVENRPN